MAWMKLLEQIGGRVRRERGREQTAGRSAASRLERYIADIPPDHYRAAAVAADARLLRQY
jgi:hypothetical protein